jgi:uncharacterized protein (TIGR03083 family)
MRTDTDLDALETMSTPAAKAELLARLPPARAALEEVLATLGSEQLAAPGPRGWSVKDHLAHLAVWDQMIVAHLRDGSDHAIIGLDQSAYAAISLDALNDRIYQQNKERTPADVLAAFREARTQTLAVLDELDESVLRAPYWPDDPDRSTIEKIAGDTYLHDLEHRRWIQDLIASS